MKRMHEVFTPLGVNISLPSLRINHQLRSLPKLMQGVRRAGLTLAPEVARALDSRGRETSRAALRKIMAQAQASGLLIGRPAELAEQFAGLLWGLLMVSLLLGVAERPNPREIAVRARDAGAAFLQLHPLPKEHAPE